MGEKIDGDGVEHNTIQNNSGDARGFQTIVQGGTVYIGETHIHHSIAESSPLDRGRVESESNLAMTLTDAQRQRLITQRDSLQSAWDIESQKLARLRQAHAIEAGTAVKFQLEKQIEAAEAEVNQLTNRLNEIEHLLANEPDRSQTNNPPNIAVTIEDLEFPEGVVTLNSRFYMEPDGKQTQCQQAITIPGALLRIQAPGQMGKTSLLDRIVDYAQGLNYHIAKVDLRDADREILQDLDLLLQWLCQQVSDCLNIPIEVAENWKNRGGSKSTCTNFFQKHILTTLQQPLLLSLDNLELMFVEPMVGEDFGSLLRSWHEKKNDTWNRVRLVLLHTWYIQSQNINNSPFNVGRGIKLPGLTAQQVRNLVTLHRLNWDDRVISRLTDLLGYHPYLIRFALYHIATRQKSLDEVLTKGHLGDGLFKNHLLRYQKYLEDQPEELRQIMAQVVRSEIPPIVRSSKLEQLVDAGLVKLDGDRVLPANRLYQLYFTNRL